MLVYVVTKEKRETRPTSENFDEDGYYDDYYDEEFVTEEFVGIYFSMINAINDVSEIEKDDSVSAYWFPYEITDTADSVKDIADFISKNPECEYIVESMGSLRKN